jgi:hypothetical protein
MKHMSHACLPALILGLAVSLDCVGHPVYAVSSSDPVVEVSQREQTPQATVLSLKPEKVLKPGEAMRRDNKTPNGEELKTPGIAPSLEDLYQSITTLSGGITSSDECSTALRDVVKEGGEKTVERLKDSATGVGHSKTCSRPDLQRALIEQRRAFRFLKKWAGACLKNKACGTDAEKEALRQRVDDLKSRLDDVLERENLREPFVAELVTGLAFGTPPEGSEEGTSTLPGAFVRWRSNPFGFGYDADRDLDFTIGGRFGYVPALALVKPAEPADTEAPETLKYQEALGWDIRLNARRHFGGQIQLVASAGLGQLILNTESSVGKLGGKDALFTIVPNSVGRAAFFWDGQLAFRLFKRNREVFAEQQSLNPGLEVTLGVRHDTRFKQDGQTSLVTYDSPERRYLFRLLLSDLPVFDRRDKADKSKEAPTFTVTFGVEHEFGTPNGLPSVTRILLVGDLALLKALNGSR